MPKNKMTNYLIVPGPGNAGPEHWQTWFENFSYNFSRIIQQEWDSPYCEQWIATIDKKVSVFDPSTVVLIGPRLGCLAIKHWAMKYTIAQ